MSYLIVLTIRFYHFVVDNQLLRFLALPFCLALAFSRYIEHVEAFNPVMDSMPFVKMYVLPSS